jgi:hypothetical protein
MKNSPPIRAILISTDLRDAAGHGFHRFVFRIEAGSRAVGNVTVQISQDAFEKLTRQLARDSGARADGLTVLRTWAHTELMGRMRDPQNIAPLITITASDVDDFGGYATELGRSLKVG